MKKDKKELLSLASRTISLEAGAVSGLKKSLGRQFLSAIDTLNSCSGKIILCGIGKSGIVAKKISATLVSIGIESTYIHPVEALHGDMGIITSQDAALALSNSGQTEELNALLRQLKARKVKIIAITSNPSSVTARTADLHLNLNVRKEACPHNLVPTSSTTAMMAMGDAIAVCLMKLKGFEKQTFAAHHPGGKLGKILNVKVSSIMRKGVLNPAVKSQATVAQAISKMTSSALGAVSVVDSKGKLIGFFTDGDLRRKFSSISPSDRIEKHMTRNPLSISPERTAAEAASLLEKKKIDNLPVTDRNGKLLGVIDERDLIREGLL